jgi:DNA-directed RNA polymerase specialized sigma subunit
MKVEDILKDQDCLSIAKKAAIPFSGVLSQDEINYCITNAAWNSVKSYDSEKNAKLTTFLYKGVVIECTKQLKSNTGKNRNLSLGHLTSDSFLLEDRSNHAESLDLIDEVKNCEDPDIMYGRFFENKTLKELAKEKKLTKEAIRLRIKKNLKIIKSRIDSGV